MCQGPFHLYRSVTCNRVKLLKHKEWHPLLYKTTLCRSSNLCVNVRAWQTCPALTVWLGEKRGSLVSLICLHMHQSRPKPFCRSALIWKNLTPSLHQCSFCGHCILSPASISNLRRVGKLQTSTANDTKHEIHVWQSEMRTHNETEVWQVWSAC